MRRAWNVLSSTATILLLAASPAVAADRTATPSTLASVFAAAKGGDTILLANGDYGFTGGAKTSMVTLRPADGASTSIYVQFGAGVSNVKLDGFKDIGGWQINGAKNVTISNSTFTYALEVIGNVSGLVLEGNRFDGLGRGTWEGRLSFSGASGATVRGNHFGGGGCSDGIQLTGNTQSVVITGNEFEGLRQGSCSAHVDPIQFYGSHNTTVSGNYFHDNSTGIMSPDGNGSPFTATNNVFVGSGDYPWAIVNGGGQKDTIRHNTVIGWTVEIGKGQNGVNASGVTLTDNILDGVTILSPQPASGVTQANNLIPSTSARFAGGAGRCGYALSPLSSGLRAASDGTDIGINDCAVAGPTPTPSPTATPTASATPTPSPEPTPTPYAPACAPNCDATVSDLHGTLDDLQARLNDALDARAEAEARIAAALAALQ